MLQPGRSAQACILCHKKKVKCDFATNKQQCKSCELGGFRCRPYQRKRKHYSISPSPPAPVRALQGTPFRHAVLQFQEQSEIGLALENDAWQLTTPSVSALSHTQARLPTPTGRPDRTDHGITVAHPPHETANSHLTPGEESYLGRSEYLGGSIPFNEGTIIENPPNENVGLSEIDLQVLHLHRAFNLPPRVTRESLIDKFFQLCSPWMPIVERCWVEKADVSPPSLFLLQAVFLAGSRVTSNSLLHASSQDYYRRARALFFSGYEKNTIFSITALCLLQWWNPTGPEQISTDTSGLWVRIAVGMAYQAGLHREPTLGSKKDQMHRRRIWWTLVCRDSVISVGLGRPRTIILEDSDVRPPSIEDFPVQDSKAYLFVAYVSICQLLGDVAQCYRRKWLSSPARQDIENSLFRWIKELPTEFQIYHNGSNRSSSTCIFEALQLLIPYFVILVILNRGPGIGVVPSAVSLVASSFVVSIYEEFIARDEVRHLGPAFTFYALAAGLSQLSGYRFASLADAAEENFKVIQLSLELLAKRWGSANGALRALLEARNTVLRLPRHPEPPMSVPSKFLSFFGDFDATLCNMGHLFDTSAEILNIVTEDIGTNQFASAGTGSPITHFQQLQQDGMQTATLPETGLPEGNVQNLSSVTPSIFPYLDGEYGQLQEGYLWDTAYPF